MAYLHSFGIVHNDLAPRNVLLDSHLNCKVTDFGLSKMVSNKDATITYDHKQRIPVMYMPPELFLDHIIGLKLDSWSYGISCIEIYKNGEQPFGPIPGIESVKKIKNGIIPNKPELMDNNLYRLIEKLSLEYNYKKRACFETILKSLHQYESLKGKEKY
ncbi:MAG: hypothetical protein MHPSP_003829 [Paramarteilia canceri]